MILSSANAFRAKNLKWITLPLCLYVNTHFQISPAYHDGFLWSNKTLMVND